MSFYLLLVNSIRSKGKFNSPEIECIFLAFISFKCAAMTTSTTLIMTMDFHNELVWKWNITIKWRKKFFFTKDPRVERIERKALWIGWGMRVENKWKTFQGRSNGKKLDHFISWPFSALIIERQTTHRRLQVSMDHYTIPDITTAQVYKILFNKSYFWVQQKSKGNFWKDFINIITYEIITQ